MISTYGVVDLRTNARMVAVTALARLPHECEPDLFHPGHQQLRSLRAWPFIYYPVSQLPCVETKDALPERPEVSYDPPLKVWPGVGSPWGQAFVAVLRQSALNVQNTAPTELLFSPCSWKAINNFSFFLPFSTGEQVLPGAFLRSQGSHCRRRRGTPFPVGPSALLHALHRQRGQKVKGFLYLCHLSICHDGLRRLTGRSAQCQH